MCQLCALAGTFTAYPSRQESLVFDLKQFAATIEAKPQVKNRSEEIKGQSLKQQVS